MSKAVKYPYPINLIRELYDLSNMETEIASEFISNIDIGEFKKCLNSIDPTQVHILQTKYQSGGTIKEAGAMIGMGSSAASKEKVKAFEQLKSKYMKSKYMK